MIRDLLVDMPSLPDELRQHYLRSGLWDDTTLGSLLLNGLRRFPHQRIQTWSRGKRRRETFQSLDVAAHRFAAGLVRCGVGPGDPVVLWLPNGWQALVAFVGVAALGAVIVPLAPFYGRKEIIDVVNASGAPLVITASQHGNRQHEDEVRDAWPLMPSLRTLVICGGAHRRSAEPHLVMFDDMLGTPMNVPAPRSPDEVCVLAFTSSTSGTAKGVAHTHRTLGAEVRCHLATMVGGIATPQIMASPITHAAGMTLGLLAPIHRGEPVHLVDSFDIDLILDAAHQEGLAPGGGAEVFLSALIDHPKFTDELAARMGAVILGGSAVPETLVAKAAARGVTVLRCYGLTEHPTVSCGRIDDDPKNLAHTDGRLLDGVEVEIRDSTGAIQSAGYEGEIFTRGPDRCAGYLRPQLNVVFDGEGWMSTGDIGFLNSAGHLTVTGRAKDLIIRHGVNISPAEIESVLLTCSSIADVAVIGVPDARTGERAVAVVVARHAADVTLDTLTGHLARLGVAKPKWPEEVRLVAELPRTASGKVIKSDLRKVFS